MYTLIVYLYNVSFLLMYIRVVNTCSYTYKMTNMRIFYYILTLYVVWTVEATFAFGYDISRSGVGVSTVDLGYFFVRILLFAMGGISYVHIIQDALEAPVRWFYYLPVVSVVVINVVLLFGEDYTYMVPLGNSAKMLCTIVIGIIYLVQWHRKEEQNLPDGRWIAALTIVFMLVANLEQWYRVCVSGRFFLSSARNMVNITEDAYTVVMIVIILWYAKKEREKSKSKIIEEMVQNRMNEYLLRAEEYKESDKERQIVGFCRFYALTERETEILRMVLNGSSNQDIADELYITVGTVKTHIHSIFVKMNVERRSQLMKVFIDYVPQKEQSKNG